VAPVFFVSTVRPQPEKVVGQVVLAEILTQMCVPVRDWSRRRCFGLLVRVLVVVLLIVVAVVRPSLLMTATTVAGAVEAMQTLRRFAAGWSEA